MGELVLIRTSCFWKSIVLILEVLTKTKADVIQDTVYFASALPIADIALGASPISTFQSDMKLQCFRECINQNCQSFNFGSSLCELFDTYLCQNISNLEFRPGYKHYDVLNGSMMELIDLYKDLVECTDQGRCSPLCYESSSTSTPSISPSSSVSPTTTGSQSNTVTATGSQTASSTETGSQSTTGTERVTQTNEGSTTETFSETTAGSTTVTVSQTTAGSTTVTAITTTTSGESTEEPPSPGEVHYACDADGDCLTEFSDCRNSEICECIAGYSYESSSKSCVTSCAQTYGNTFHATNGRYLFGFNYKIYTETTVAACKQHCLDYDVCISFDFDNLLNDCTISTESKFGNDEFWFIDPFYEYYQRNCA